MRHLLGLLILLLNLSVSAATGGGDDSVVPTPQQPAAPVAQPAQAPSPTTTSAPAQTPTTPGVPGVPVKPKVLDGSPNDIGAAVLVNVPGQPEPVGGVISVEPTPQNPDALNILREELQRMNMVAQAQEKKDGVFLSKTKSFTPESITFFLAIGAVTFNSMWIKSHGDPLAMEKHILSLKDPIAHLSFYAFMQSQGFYMHFQQKGAKFQLSDPHTKAQLMRRFNYQGMAIGSLASSIVSDLGHSVKQCVDSWLHGKTDEKSLASCDQAWVHWTARNKFNQYFPQIISMWTAQAATDLIEGGMHKVFPKVTNSSWIKSITSMDFLVKQAYKITAVDVAITVAPGTITMKSIRWVGKLTRFMGFVGVDHILSTYTYRPLNNIIRPLQFDFDVFAINALWAEADKGVWDSSRIKNAKNLKKFEAEIENFGDQMQQWRDHLNSDAEADLAGWMEMTKKLLNQIDYAYRYYKFFSTSMLEYLNRGYEINNKKLAESAITTITRYPFRTLPLYGVSIGPVNTTGGQAAEFYLLNPNKLEAAQFDYILKVAEKFTEVKKDLTRPEEIAAYDKILEKLQSKDLNKMASGLHQINKTIEDYRNRKLQDRSQVPNRYLFLDILTALKTLLGNPQPVVYPFAGFSQAFASYSVNQTTAEAADFSKWKFGQYSFNKEPDLMFYNLICGTEKSKFHRVKMAGVDFISPQFEPPTMLLADPVRKDYCNKYVGASDQTILVEGDITKDFKARAEHYRTTGDLYARKIDGKSLQDYVLAKMNYDAVGDYRVSDKSDNFDIWWLKYAKDPVSVEFKKYDIEFQKLFEKSYNNMFDQRNFYKFFVDLYLNHSRYLPTGMQSALKFETNLYLQILTRAMMIEKASDRPETKEGFFASTWNIVTKNSSFYSAVDAVVKDLTREINYVEFSKKNSEELNFTSLYKNVPKEIIELNDLLNSYYDFVRNKDVRFEQYIAHSKKIDTAVNEILVKLGMKKVVESAPVVQDLSAGAAATGTENSDKNYEDVVIKTPTYKQSMAVAALKGIKRVESEIRRFIRMRITLAQSLDVDTKEFMADWQNANQSQGNYNRKANPRGSQ